MDADGDKVVASLEAGEDRGAGVSYVWLGTVMAGKQMRRRDDHLTAKGINLVLKEMVLFAYGGLEIVRVVAEILIHKCAPFMSLRIFQVPWISNHANEA